MYYLRQAASEVIYLLFIFLYTYRVIFCMDAHPQGHNDVKLPKFRKDGVASADSWYRNVSFKNALNNKVNKYC